jgi:kynurenine formamidase
VRRGAAEVRDGRRFSLAMHFGPQSPQVGAIPGRINPLRTMVSVNTPYSALGADGFCVSDDIVVMGLQASTHWDGLAHVSYGGVLWNGVPASTVTAEAGSRELGIHRVRSLTSRGVLLDVARARVVERLDPGQPVTADDLDAAADLSGVSLAPGDVVLVRTGQARLYRDRKRMEYATGDQPGLNVSCPAWFRAHDVAAVATDTLTLEVYPCEDADVQFPVHMLDLVDLGLTQGQNFDLEDLAADCAADGRYAFLLEASPIPFTGGVGAPVNPVAIK